MPKTRTLRAPGALTVTLAYAANPDLMYGQGTGTGYWGSPLDPGKPRRISVSTMEEARRVMALFIRRNGLGGGNIPRSCGVIRLGKTVVGRVAYNGRVFQPGSGEMVDGRYVPMADIDVAAWDAAHPVLDLRNPEFDKHCDDYLAELDAADAADRIAAAIMEAS